jgi:hypothetical protein
MSADVFIKCLKDTQFKQDLDDLMGDGESLSLDEQGIDAEMEI